MLLFLPNFCEVEGLDVERGLEGRVCHDDRGVALVVELLAGDDVLEAQQDLGK